MDLYGSPGFEAGLGYDNNTGLGSLTGGLVMGHMVAVPNGVASGSGTRPSYPTNFAVSNVTPTTATLSWTPVKGATGYVLTISKTDTYYGDVDEDTFFFKSTSHTVVNLGYLKPNTGYTFYISAVNKAGGSVLQSNTGFYTPPAK